jgi:hypothetical protein
VIFENDVFLSYSAADTEIVRALAERLHEAGLRVWLDPCLSAFSETTWVRLFRLTGREMDCCYDSSYCT